MPLDFDVVIFGTGVTEAILAGALAKAGKRVCHLDSRDMYGGPGAALALDAFLQNVNGAVTYSNPSDDDVIESDKLNTEFPSPTTTSPSSSLLKQSRKYAIEMAPKLIYSNGSLVQTMIDSNVSNYLEFRAVESVSMLWAGAFDTVPCSKEDIFKNESIPLLEKRRLMKLLSKVTEPDEPSDDVARAIDPHASLPLLEFLVSQGLSERSRAILLYGV
ncbi:GDP dissociation inhibitor, partial [Chytriomyces cf. hyalinus JEL632]